MKFGQYVRERKRVESGLLHLVPSYGAALLHVSLLCQQLSFLTFLVFDAEYAHL